MSAGLPNIIGTVDFRSPFVDSTGAFYKDTATTTRIGGNQSNKTPWLAFSASKSNSIYGNSTTVTPKSLSCTIILKY